MRPGEFNEPKGRGGRRGGKFELFFWEKIGTRYHLRFTRLALVLVVCLTVIPAAAIFALFFTRSRADLENVNVDIRVPPQAPRNYGNLIVQPPPLTMPTVPKVGRSQGGGEPARQKPGLNAGTPPTPSPTPSPTPPRPPD